MVKVVNADGEIGASVEVAHDNVHQPQHYTYGGVQLKDAWRACMSKEALCGMFKGNVLKYLWRYEHKNGVEDLKKARQYLDWLIEVMEEEETK